MTLFKYSMKKAIKYMVVLLSIIILLFFGYSNNLVIHAEEDIDITTTSVRDDLKSMDEDKLSYLSDEDFIFIAMSQYYDKEENLRTYLYVNFPYGEIVFDDYHAFVNISTSVMDENYNVTEDFELYSIKYVNHEETWYKLEVLNLPNLEEITRRYYIQDFRTYMNSLENTSSLDDYMSCDEVSKVYIFNGVSNNTIKVFKQEMETITITDKEVVCYCYGYDLNFFGKETGLLSDGNVYNDAFFIFFNTDKTIDELIEIELTYQQFDFCIGATGTTNNIEYSFTEFFVNNWLEGDKTGYTGSAYDNDFYINYHEQVIDIIEPGKKKVEASKVNFWGKVSYKYEELDNIMNMKDYKAQNESDFIFTDYANNYSWGVHFLDTDRTFTKKGSNASAGLITASSVCNTAILRLKFVTDGIVHNAYAVDTPTDDVTGNSANTQIPKNDDFPIEFLIITILVLCVFILIYMISLNIKIDKLSQKKNEENN